MCSSLFLPLILFINIFIEYQTSFFIGFPYTSWLFKLTKYQGSHLCFLTYAMKNNNSLYKHKTLCNCHFFISLNAILICPCYSLYFSFLEYMNIYFTSRDVLQDAWSRSHLVRWCLERCLIARDNLWGDVWWWKGFVAEWGIARRQ